jgi:hypothetical protein
MPAHVDITGQRFGRLTALYMTAKAGRKPRRDQRWLFRCTCGNETEVGKQDVTQGKTVSCGCRHAETSRETGKKNATHGHTRSRKPSPEYSSWCAMHKRCGNPNDKHYKDYGGRGITVCQRWNSFEAFLANMGLKPYPKHTIDRIDPNGNYEPGNCRWATSREQRANTRRNNRLFTIGGRTQTILQWAREASIDPGVSRQRIEAGWHPELIRRLLHLCRERAEGVKVA